MLLLIFFKKDAESEKVYVNEKCVQSWIAKGFSRETARLICASQLKDTAVEQGFKIKTIYSTEKVKTEKKKKEETEEEKKKKKEIAKKKKPKIGTFKAQAEVRVRFEKEKPGAMANPILAPERGMKSEHKLQTKMERLTTEEEKFLTEEQLLKRAQYAKEIRKRDAFYFLRKDTDCKTVSEYISGCIKKHVKGDKTMTRDQCIKVAMDKKRAGELIDSFEILVIADAYSGKVKKLNGVYEVPVILAREMIQEYGDMKHFKPFSELVKGIKDLDSLPVSIDHKPYTKDTVIGYVKRIRADGHDRSIKGLAYLPEKNLPESMKVLLDNNGIIPVSIGFFAYLAPGGIWGGESYDVTQTEFKYDHLTLCDTTIARCPPNLCGLNLDSAENEQDEQLKLIYDYNDNLNIDNYYKIINLEDIEETRKLSDLETNGGIMPKQETDAETPWDEFIAKMVKRYDSKEKAEKICEFIKVKFKDSDFFVITDAELQEIEDEVFGKQSKEPGPDDLAAILTRLWKFIGGIASPEAKNEAINRILNKIKPLKKSDSNMDEKEFKESIALKDSEISKLEKELEDAKKALQEIEDAKKKADLIKTIKEFSKLEDAYLEKKDVHDLEVIADAVKEFSPSDEKGKKIPKKKKEDSSKYTRKNPADTFNDIIKQFPKSI